MKPSTFLCFALLFSVACGDSADDKDGKKATPFEIIDQVLQGSINGQEFKFGYGIATMDDRRGEVSVTLLAITPSDTNRCTVPSDYKGPRILFFRKPEVAGSPLSFDKNITFSYETPEVFQNDVALTGEWRFDFVDDEIIRGALAAKTDEHQVNGKFELRRCPDPFANF